MILEDADAEIAEGATAIVGPSGAGKSSFLRLFNRLADPDRGTVRFRGEPLADLNVLALRRRVGLVPQVAALLEGSVASNLSYARDLGERRSQRSDAELLGLAGLVGSFAERDSQKLSVGEQQRVMLARALATDPEVLLLDEPTSALDAAATEAVEAALGRLRDEAGVSIVIVTHDAAQAKRLAGKTLRLADRKLLEETA